MAIDRYAERFGITGVGAFEQLFLLIRAMDAEYMAAARVDGDRKRRSEGGMPTPRWCGPEAAPYPN